MINKKDYAYSFIGIVLYVDKCGIQNKSECVPVLKQVKTKLFSEIL